MRNLWTDESLARGTRPVRVCDDRVHRARRVVIYRRRVIRVRRVRDSVDRKFSRSVCSSSGQTGIVAGSRSDDRPRPVPSAPASPRVSSKYFNTFDCVPEGIVTAGKVLSSVPIRVPRQKKL